MQKDKNSQAKITTNDIIISELTSKNNDLAFVKEYLKAGFVSSAVDQLFNARRQAGLTQAQIADQMSTKQTAIARLEADTEGSISFRRYVDFALVCGKVPLEVTLVPIEHARNFVIENPDLPLNQMNYYTWLLAKKAQLVPATQNTQSAVILDQSTIAKIQVTKASTQYSAEYEKQLSCSKVDQTQSTLHQYKGGFAA